MKEERIRLTSTNSADSVDEKAFVDVELQHHTKTFPFPSISNTIDQMQVFEQERAECTDYRLILTINPYCTNVLFNAVTEIVKDEGTDVLNDLAIATRNGTYKGNSSILTYKNNVDMIRNTEYTNKGYVYHCGYDIFNNHILRNQTFKLVNVLNENSKKHKNTSNSEDVNKNYNTIRDIMRYSDGTEVKLTKRTDINTIEGASDRPSQNDARHLYLKDDILGFIDAINANLSEQNGWWGFNNRSTIPSTKFEDGEWADLMISKVFNGSYFNGIEEQEYSGCQFIEMYPDSTLYSFNPKYNEKQNRNEQNWDICITYPYENYDDNDKVLIKGKIANDLYINALLLVNYKLTKGTSGQDIILFRSYVKHNLKRGDNVKLYYCESGQDIFHEIEDVDFEIENVGDLENNNTDYYFYIRRVEEIDKLFSDNPNKSYIFRFIRISNGRNCKYYYRKFRKLPNLKFKKEELTEDIINNEEQFERYIINNCMMNGTMLQFNNERYPLAFSRTIYGDDIAQLVFTDTLDIDKFTDNLGRPLTELYVTIIKRNKGHELWYKRAKTKDDLKEIEFSHCFGKVTSGLDIHSEMTDNNDIIDSRRNISDCTLITNSNDSQLDEDITIENTDIFFGDVVELDPYNINETVLSEVHFRFNTEQREHDFNNNSELDCSYFVFDEIETDDYDKEGFKCTANELNDKPTYRPEGYHYKAHYPIKVREFGSLHQASNKVIKISSCRPKQANGMFIEVVSVLRSGVNSGDIVYLCDENEEMMLPLTVNSVQSNTRFLLNPMIPGSENYISIFEIVQGLLYSERTINKGESWTDEHGHENIAQNDNETVKDYGKPIYTLKIKNNDIPSYAHKIATNMYLWRDILNVGNKDAVELTEYPFANGHFYINKNINFFLKRQDPFGYNGLFDINKIPNDVYGNVKKQSNYEYKDEKNRVC